jgi:hypothetical protein
MPGTRSGLWITDHWLVTEPVGVTLTMTHDEFFSETFSHVLASGLVLSTNRGGILSMDFSARESALVASTVSDDLAATMTPVGDRVAVFSALSLCLHSVKLMDENVGIEVYPVTHRSLLHFSDGNIRWTSDMPLHAVPGLGIVIGVGRSGVFTQERIANACHLLDRILLHPEPVTLTAVSLLNEALVASQSNNHALAVVTSWTISELLLARVWSAYLDEARGLVKSDELREMRGRKYTAAMRSAKLVSAGKLSETLVADLDVSRRKRNKWLHGTEPVTPRDSAKAIETAQKMIAEVLHLTFAVSPRAHTVVI